MTSQNKHWLYENVRAVHLEASTLCNSICPWCPRYNNFSPNLNPNIVEEVYTLKRFKDHFPQDFIKQINFWTFAGDYGDPCTSPELLPILEYITEVRPDSAMQINTNGGMKTTPFWIALGELFRQNHSRYVIFSVDGLEDTNHIYRRNVKWNKVRDNMYCYSQTGATGIWEFLKFKHNEHQLKEAKEMADWLGFEIRFKNPNGFEGGPMPARDKDYNIEYEMFPATGREINEIPQRSIDFINLINTDTLDYADYKDRVESLYEDKPGCITCAANHTLGGGNEIRINCDGAVWPCSFFGHLSKKYLKNRIVGRIQQWQIEDVLKDIHNNLNEMPLKEILDSDPFRPVYERWEGNRMLECYDVCGPKPIMEKIYESASNGR